MPELDERDREIIAERETALNKVDGPRIGDWVRFNDGVMHRVCHVHNWTEQDRREYPSLVAGVQTTVGGSFHLANGSVSYSGGLDPTLPFEKLTPTGETRDGRVWIFHHDSWRADNGVDFTIPFRVYEASVPSGWWRRA